MATLLKEHLEEITLQNNKELDFEKIFLGDFEINHCNGCRVCMERGEQYCPINDDVTLIKNKMKDASAVVFASPVYVGDVSSSMKALIDRLAYICHRPEFYKKYALILATTNSTSLKRTIHTIGAATYSWGFKTVGTGGFTTISSNDSMQTLRERYNTKISKLALDLYSEINTQGFLNPSIISLSSFRLQQKSRADPEQANHVDFKYWDKNGWTDKERQYYFDIETSRFKLFLSGILTKIMALIF